MNDIKTVYGVFLKKEYTSHEEEDQLVTDWLHRYIPGETAETLPTLFEDELIAEDAAKKASIGYDKIINDESKAIENLLKRVAEHKALVEAGLRSGDYVYSMSDILLKDRIANPPEPVTWFIVKPIRLMMKE